MPYATNDDIRIYYETEGSGPPLLLHHGFTMSHQVWRRRGYIDALRGDYELILMDARGHGASDKPHDPVAYALDKRVADVVAVLDDAGIERPIFWGDSMGGHVGYAIAQYAPDRFTALVIGGSHPYPRDREASRQWAESLRQDGIANFVAVLERHFGMFSPEMRALILANDADALAACELAAGAAPSFADALENAPIPMLVYVGERDDACEKAGEAAANPRVTFIKLSGLDHVQCGERSDIVLPHVRAFLANENGALNA